MNEDKIREIECEKHIERFDSVNPDEVQSRVYELEELVGSLTVYLQEMIDVATGRDLVTTVSQVVHDFKNDTTTMNTLKSMESGIYYKQLMESLK